MKELKEDDIVIRYPKFGDPVDGFNLADNDNMFVRTIVMILDLGTPENNEYILSPLHGVKPSSLYSVVPGKVVGPITLIGEDIIDEKVWWIEDE